MLTTDQGAYCGIHLIVISQKILKIFIVEKSLKFIYFETVVKCHRDQWVNVTVDILELIISDQHVILDRKNRAQDCEIDYSFTLI